MKDLFSLRNHPSFRLFILMFSIVCLLSINSDILRSARNALTVADLGGSAALIPHFELYGTLPGAILMTWLITRLMKRWPIHKVFLMTLSLFLGFFNLFAFVIYPLLSAWLTSIGGEPTLILSNCIVGATMSFYVIGELWKVIFLAVLFWALVNQYMALSEAKSFYGPLMLGTSLGAILSGPLISLCTSDLGSRWFRLAQEPWAHSLDLLVILITLVGLCIAALYLRLWGLLNERSSSHQLSKEQAEYQEKISFKECLIACFRSPYLLLLAWIVCADYLAYSLGEVVFYDVVKEYYPHPRDYCHYMGKLTSWTGIATFLSSVIITPWLLKRYKWVVTSIITPFSLMLTGTTFFLIFCMRDHWEPWRQIIGFDWIQVMVMLGSIQYCLCRAAKYTLFDSSKELAFVMLPNISKIQGKLIIDGIGARFGRGTASFVSIVLIQTFGGIKACALLMGLIAVATAISSTWATFRLGKLVEEQNETNKQLKPLDERA